MFVAAQDSDFGKCGCRAYLLGLLVPKVLRNIGDYLKMKNIFEPNLLDFFLGLIISIFSLRRKGESYTKIMKFVPDGSAYNYDKETPVFSWRKEPYDPLEIVAILDFPQDFICSATPIYIAHNASFLLDREMFVSFGDVFCDEMGVWKHTGTPKRKFYVTRDIFNNIKNITDHESNQSSASSIDTYELKRAYFRHSTYDDVRKIVSTMTGNFLICQSRGLYII